MKCSRIRKMFSPYVDGELGKDEEKALASHLEGCPDCRKELEEVQSLQRLFASAERFEAPAGFAARIMERIEGQERAPSSFWGFFTLQPAFVRAVEVAFAVILILVGVFSGDILMGPTIPADRPTIQESFSLDLFQAMPSDSIGGTYMRLAGIDHER